MTYRYATRDLLREPERYMFTPFEGAELLDAYVTARRCAVDDLRSRAAGWATMGEVPEPGERRVETRPLLEALVAARRAGDEPAAVDRWARLLLRRFEVFKRIGAAYGVDLRREGDAVVEPGDYALLALLLALTPSLPDDLQALSCLLKLGDVLCSVDPSDLHPLGAGAAADALEAEVAAVRALARRHEVELP